MKNSTLQKIGTGVGILAAATAATAAGYYFYGSKDAKAHRQAGKRWARNLKNDIVRQAKKLKNIDQATLLGVVDEVAKTYESVRGLDKGDLRDAREELRQNWQLLKKEILGKSISRKKKAGRSGAARKVRNVAKKST